MPTTPKPTHPAAKAIGVAIGVAICVLLGVIVLGLLVRVGVWVWSF